MVMLWWWLGLGIVVLGLLMWLVTRKRKPLAAAAVVANAWFLTQLEAYRSYMTHYRLMRSGVVIVGVAAVLATATLSSRQISEESLEPELATRDIVLCLDVSTSMADWDKELLEKFSSMVDSFHGERVALSIFNSTSRTVVPLTDDYDMLTEELSEGARLLPKELLSLQWQDPEDADIEFVDGTLGVAGVASLIGDGLASCSLLFDHADEERSRSIILASDNEVNGEQIYGLKEAAEMLEKRDIHLFSLYPGEYSCFRSCRAEFEEVTAAIGGTFYQANDSQAVPGIVEEIQEQQQVSLDAEPEVIQHDHPELWVVLAVLTVAGFLGIAWRLDI